MADGPYSRIYHVLMDEYPSVWRSDTQLALFASANRLPAISGTPNGYPLAPTPRLPPEMGPTNHYCDLDSFLSRPIGNAVPFAAWRPSVSVDRPGRHAANVRWQSERNANAMPVEKRREEKEQSTPRARQRTSHEAERVGDILPRAIGNGEEPEIDACVFAVRILGYAPNNADSAPELVELETKFGMEETVQAEQNVYRAFINDGRRPKPFDLIKDTRTLLMTGHHLHEKAQTAEEKAEADAKRKAKEAEMLADIKRQQDEESAAATRLEGCSMTIHDLILAIVLSWAGIDIAVLYLLVRRAWLRDER